MTQGKCKGRPEDAGIAHLFAEGPSWSNIQFTTRCSRATVAKIAKRICMMTMLLVTFLILLIPVLFLRTTAEEAAAVLASIGMIVFGFNYPVGFGITMAVVFLIIAVWLGYHFARRGWRPK